MSICRCLCVPQHLPELWREDTGVTLVLNRVCRARDHRHILTTSTAVQSVSHLLFDVDFPTVQARQEKVVCHRHHFLLFGTGRMVTGLSRSFSSSFGSPKRSLISSLRSASLSLTSRLAIVAPPGSHATRNHHLDSSPTEFYGGTNADRYHMPETGPTFREWRRTPSVLPYKPHTDRVYGFSFHPGQGISRGLLFPIHSASSLEEPLS